MGRYQVSCIVKRGNHYNPHERISHIGNLAGQWMMTEESAIWRMESGSDTFYTNVNGRSAEIVVAVHNGRKYLKTDADGYSPNNLLSLPECTGCRTV